MATGALTSNGIGTSRCIIIYMAHDGNSEDLHHYAPHYDTTKLSNQHAQIKTTTKIRLGLDSARRQYLH